MRRLVTLAAVALGLVSCAPSGREPSCTAYAEGACLVADETADPGSVPTPGRVSEVLEAAFAFWGAPSDALASWKIIFSADGALCGSPDAGACTIWSAQEIRVLVPRLGRCPEGALAHELGHVVIPGGDPQHKDLRFGKLRSVLARLGC